MCDEHLQSLSTRVPVVILHRVEKTFPTLREGTNCVDLRNHKPGLCTETCHTSSGDSNQVTGIKVEEVISIKEEEDPEPI
jgi:hypothetical protein